MYLCIYNSQKDDTEDVNGRKKKYKAESDLSTAIFDHFFPKSGFTLAWLASNSTCT